MGRRLAGLFHGRPRLQVGTLLAGPIGWLVIGYLGSLVIILITSFWSVNALSGELEKTFTLDNFQTIVEEPVYRTIAGRTIAIAALVTITDALLAFPIAFYMAKVASSRMKALLVVAVLLPLWSSYLVKVYAWRTILSSGGILNELLDPFGVSGPGYGNVAVWLVMSYLWLPFMIIPIYAGLERIPDSRDQRLGGPGGVAVDDLPPRDPAARLPGRGRGLDLHLLADARRLHHPGAGLQ